MAARYVPVSKTSVHNIVRRRLKLYPYKIQLVQALKPTDYAKREEFALTVLGRMEGDPNYLERIFFTDEATFHVSGLVHRHNVRIWGTENPHVVQEMFHDQVIGPFFFQEETINQNNFLEMLHQFAYPLIRDRQHDMIWQMDGCPAHWGLRVRASVNTQFPARWIGRDAPTPWPPRSPDITPLDFFFWGYVKSQAYMSPIENIDQVKK